MQALRIIVIFAAATACVTALGLASATVAQRDRTPHLILGDPAASPLALAPQAAAPLAL